MMKKYNTACQNYAHAIVETFTGNYKTLITQLNDIKESISQCEDFKLIMDNSSVSLSNKLAIIDSLLNGKVDDKIVNFIKILVEKCRLSDLEGICDCVKDLVDSIENKKDVEIISAIELDESIKTKIMIILESKLDCDVIPTWSVDKDIIAGLVFKYDDFVVDTSLKYRLENLGKNILR